MYIMILMRTLFMVCVPLFMLLTGYLMCNKKLDRKYYKGIIRTLEVYCVASILIIFFQRYYLKEEQEIRKGLLSIFGVNNHDYSWYVEMYIGLFLLVPFLNILWHQLTEKEKKILILTLLILTVIPSLLNIYDIFNYKFWVMPSSSSNYDFIFPDYWVEIYPLLYYFLGVYIREHEIKISFGKNLAMLICNIFLFGSFNYYRSKGIAFEWGGYNSFSGFESVIISILLFVLILNIDTKKYSASSKFIFYKVSQLSFGIYLVSYVVDQFVYARFNSAVPIMKERLFWYFIIVPVVFFVSAVISQIINWMCDLLEVCINKFLYNFLK